MVRSSRHSAKIPKILIVTPEITYLPEGMGNATESTHVKAGGLADVSASLVSALFEICADVHVALPHYRRMFNVHVGSLISNSLDHYRKHLPEERVHLAEDRLFYYQENVYGDHDWERGKLGVVFQRELIHRIIPQVKPDLIHCNDWMTGLIPAYAKQLGIPCLFTLHNIHSVGLTMAQMEEFGLDVPSFYENLFFERPPKNYEESRDNNKVDLLTTGIFASDYINTVSPTFLKEIAEGRHSFVSPHLRREILNKINSGRARGILNAPDPLANPEVDPFIQTKFGPWDHEIGKTANKLAAQEALGLERNPKAPLFFWPSRLDPHQKGCDLLGHILFETLYRYGKDQIQVAIVGEGPYRRVLNEIVRFHNLSGRVSVCGFEEKLSRICYAGADYLIMPSRFEPCGLPQMIGPIYGTLPIAHDTGGIHDTIHHLDPEKGVGNGFLFKHQDHEGLRWAIDQAMLFHHKPEALRQQNIKRIMRDSLARFNFKNTAAEYIKVYQHLLGLPEKGEGLLGHNFLKN